jgi:hypothetical protein
MPISEYARSAEAIHRKLRAIAAVLLDPAATEHERANAEALKICLEKQLRQEATPEGTGTNIMFRLGRAIKEIKRSASPPSPKVTGQIMPFDLAEHFVEGSRSSGRQKSYSQAARPHSATLTARQSPTRTRRAHNALIARADACCGGSLSTGDERPVGRSLRAIISPNLPRLPASRQHKPGSWT